MALDLARPKFTKSLAVRVPVGTPDELVQSLHWFHQYHIETARDELAKAQRAGALLDPVDIVDGKKGAPIEAVKFFGNITYADSIGPLREAIAAAEAFVLTAAPRETGWYRDALQWFANGNPTSGPPDAERVGARGNVQLVDLAPYASTVEIRVPRGVIFGAYTVLSRMFGKSLNIGFHYDQAGTFGGLRERPGNPAKRPYAIPVLTIGNPASTVKSGAKARPGVEARKVARHERRRAAEEAAKRGGGT